MKYKYEGVFEKAVDLKNNYALLVGLEGHIKNAKMTLKSFPKKEELSNPLKFLIELINKNKDKKIKVYDIGGAGGIDCFRVLPYIDHKNFQWEVYELKETYPYYNGFFLGLDLPITANDIGKFGFDKDVNLNIVYSRGTVQYLDDPHRFFEKFIMADYVILVEMNSSRDIPTFLTIQKGCNLCWFFNLNELEKFFKIHRFEMKEEITSSFHDMTNFEERYRLDKFRNLIFTKTK